MPVRTELSPSKRIPAISPFRSIALALTFTIAATLALPLSQAAAQGPAAAAQTPAQASAQVTAGPPVRGTITDPDDELIPGASITFAPNSGKPYTTTSGSDGTYTLRGVPAGTYNMTVTMPGFATFVKPGVKVAGAAATVINAKMSIQIRRGRQRQLRGPHGLGRPGRQRQLHRPHRQRLSTRFRTIPTNSPASSPPSPVPPPAPTAARSTSTASPAASFRPSPPSAKSASTRIPSPPSMTASASAASRSSPSPAPTSSTATSRSAATTSVFNTG